jgi:spore coat protein U-like protein
MTLNLASTLRLLAALLVSALALGIAAPSPAMACTLCSCSATTTSLHFGTYDPTSSTPSDSSGNITVNCTGLVSLFGSIDISASAGASGNEAQRTMRQGTNALKYNLYVNASRSIVFGSGAGGTQKITAQLNGLLLFGQSAAFYGRIPAKQWVKAGSYSDVIVVTVTY